MKRIEHIIKANPNGCWEEWVNKAYVEKISLSATGFYFIPGLGYDIEKNTGKRFNYYTYGAACSQVEIDCLTGDHEVPHVRLYVNHIMKMYFPTIFPYKHKI